MCGSPSVDDSAIKAQQRAAETARLEEDLRQQRIDFGLQSINSVFEGGEQFDTFEDFLLGTDQRNPLLARDEDEAARRVAKRSKQARENKRNAPPAGFRIDGKEGLTRGEDPVQRARDAAAERRALTGEREQAALLAADKPEAQSTTRGGFGGIIDSRRQAQLDFQLPQLNDRFADSRDDLAFNLSRAGLSNSSVAAGRQADLGEQFQVEDAKLRSGIENDVSGLRSRIASTKASLEASVRASADPSAAISNSLAAQERFFQEQPVASSLGDIFGATVSGLGQAANQFSSRGLSDRLGAVLSSGASGGGSGRVVT